MRSHDLASLAGVTVRTLRHYHQVGVLAEPERGHNGYRQYSVHDLIRVLRIKQLAALGVPLVTMPTVLDADEPGHDELLDQLESDLDAQEERLARQRALVRRIREKRIAPDIPPELARMLAMSGYEGRALGAVRAERDQTILIAHLVGAAGVESLAELYERMTPIESEALTADLLNRFDVLPPDADAETVAELVEDIMVRLAAALDALKSAESIALGGEATALIDQHLKDTLNRAQLAVIETMARLLDGDPASSRPW